MSTTVNLKDFPAPNEITDTQTNELINGKVSQCPDIKSVTPNPDIGIASLTGKFFNYTIEHKHGNIHVRPKINYGISVVLSSFTIPFALWFVYTFDFDVPFANYAIPLSLIFISFAITWMIGYTLGDKEQKSILSYIYNILNGRPADAPIERAKSVGINKLWPIICFIIGIAILVIFFMTR